MHISHWKFDIDARSLYFIVFHFMCYYPIAQWLRISRAKRHRWLPCNSRCISLHPWPLLCVSKIPAVPDILSQQSIIFGTLMVETRRRDIKKCFSVLFLFFCFCFPFSVSFCVSAGHQVDGTNPLNPSAFDVMLLHRLANIICRTNENQRQSKQNQEMKNVGELVTGSRK